MKTDGTPLHGSYFDLATAKYPDLKRPASGRRKGLLKRRGGRFGVLPAVLFGALVGVAWLAFALRPAESVFQLPASGETSLLPASGTVLSLPASETVLSLPPSGGTHLAAEARDQPIGLAALASESVRQESGRVKDAPATLPVATPPAAAPQKVSEPPLRTPASTPRAPTVVATSSRPPAIVPARKIFAPSPEYPPDARSTGAQGTVVVDADVDVTGVVTGTTIVRGHSPALDAAAAAALETWRFEPASRGDVAVASTYRVGIKFTLREPAVAAPSAPLEVGGEVEPPRRLAAPLPAYPDAAWVQGITGDVLVRAVIDATGAVADVEVVKGLPHGMTEAAIAAIRRWKFAPATRHGQPVAVYRNLSVRFEG